METPEGVIREYWLDLTEHDNWVGPDGVVKEKMMLYNGSFPGPVLYADWGDTFVIHLTNSLQINGYVPRELGFMF